MLYWLYAQIIKLNLHKPTQILVSNTSGYRLILLNSSSSPFSFQIPWLSFLKHFPPLHIISAVFDDDLSTNEGKGQYSFFNSDSIYDFLVSIGMKVKQAIFFVSHLLNSLSLK